MSRASFKRSHSVISPAIADHRNFQFLEFTYSMDFTKELHPCVEPDCQAFRSMRSPTRFPGTTDLRDVRVMNNVPQCPLSRRQVREDQRAAGGEGEGGQTPEGAEADRDRRRRDARNISRRVRRGVSSPRSLCSPRENDRRLVPSRIPWLPQIPEGWHLVRNKSFLRLTDEKVGDRKGRFTLLSLTKHGDIMRLFVHEFGSIRTA